MKISSLVLAALAFIGQIGSNFQVVDAQRHSVHHHLHDGRDASKDFSNQWIVHLDGTTEAADVLAMKLGYKNLGEVCGCI